MGLVCIFEKRWRLAGAGTWALSWVWTIVYFSKVSNEVKF
jgi:hypothetical protein